MSCTDTHRRLFYWGAVELATTLLPTVLHLQNKFRVGSTAGRSRTQTICRCHLHVFAPSTRKQPAHLLSCAKTRLMGQRPAEDSITSHIHKICRPIVKESLLHCQNVICCSVKRSVLQHKTRAAESCLCSHTLVTLPFPAEWTTGSFSITKKSLVFPLVFLLLLSVSLISYLSNLRGHRMAHLTWPRI